VATQPAVVAVGLEKQFVVRGFLAWRPKGFVDALRGLDISVASDTVHGVMGPNGSGKSTLLRILATLVAADRGRAAVGGCDVVREGDAVRRLIGFSTGDERSLYWRLTARENLEFAAALHRLPDPVGSIETTLGLVNLDGHADRPVSGFSQGMARRLGLARALLHRPMILLLDEPTRSLDPVSRAEFHDVISRLRDDAGVTTLLTSHDLDEAASVCDRVSVLRGGQIVDDVTRVNKRALAKAIGTL
jgi:ABC-2 type transport system ATP-binding protein